jgi:REP element-mobilizing transposase RayT
LDTLAEASEKTDWQIHAWCLMNNHFHLVTETPRANLRLRRETTMTLEWIAQRLWMGAATHVALPPATRSSKTANQWKNFQVTFTLQAAP